MGLVDFIRSILLPRYLPPEGVTIRSSPNPEFLGPAVGDGVERLQSEFRVALAALPQVERAYFCRLRFPDAAQPGAAVCLAGDGDVDPDVLEALATVIRSNVDSSSYIDVLFLSPELEESLAAVCRPFYPAGSTDTPPGTTADPSA